MMHPRGVAHSNHRTKRNTRDRVSETVRVWLLGSFRVSVGLRTIERDDWGLRKAANLVKLLALATGHRMHREEVMDLLWPELDLHAAANNLRQVLHVARQILKPDLSSSDRYLDLRNEQLTLCPNGQIWVDAEAFEEAATIARHTRDAAAYKAALELYAGDLLPGDRYEGWAENRREELRQLYITLLIELADLYEGRGEFGPAIEALGRAASSEPTREEVHVGLMRLHALSGQRQRALKQYELLRDTLSRELGTEPSMASRRLREELAAGRLPSSREPPAAPPAEVFTVAGRHNNLPAPRTSFVGRERELTEVKRDLAMTRLLTLAGAGGSGKTRLALEVARDLVGAYPGGVWLAELAPLSEGELVGQAVAEALGVREQPGRSLTETIADALRQEKTLLVLDNCEHLVYACARLVDTLLARCSRLRVLATGREPLGVGGEAVWQVSSLSAPDTYRLPPLGELTRYEAVRLFVDRARLRLPNFELTPENGRAVAEVCGRLEGIPLAIELATARVGTLTVGEVAERLGDSLGLLTTGPRTAPPRQQTMRATLEWSYGLLAEPEKKLFRRLSVFAGGFRLEAAEAVGTDESIQEGNVLDLLGTLVEKSLVVVDTAAERGVRYRMLEPVRQYARERLEESDEAEAVKHQHTAFFLALAERAELELKGPGQVEWLERLEEDNDNLRAAMAWLLEKGGVESAVRLAWALWVFWLIHGHQDEGRRWIEEALDKGGHLTAHARAKALWVQAVMSYGLGSPEQLRRLCEEAAALFRRVGDKLGLAYAMSGVGAAMMQQGDAERAITLLKESIELTREVGDKRNQWGVSTMLSHLGSVYLSQGDYEQAMRYFEEGLALTREIGNMFSGSTALYNLALAAQGQGDHERAAELYAEGLRFAVDAGDKAHIAYCLEGLAQVAAVRGEPEHAARLFGSAEVPLEAASGVLYAYVQDRSLHEQAVDAIRSQLDETAFSAAWAKGGAMSIGDAVEYALSGEEPAPPVTPGPGQPPTGTQPAPLTRREEQVAALVARGLTNRQIAAELSISEHTVANHVAKILHKLGLSSRSQIATWIVEQRLLS